MTVTSAAVLLAAQVVVALAVGGTLYWVFVGGAHNGENGR